MNKIPIAIIIICTNIIKLPSSNGFVTYKIGNATAIEVIGNP